MIKLLVELKIEHTVLNLVLNYDSTHIDTSQRVIINEIGL